MFQRVIETTKSLFFPTFDLPQQKREPASPSLSAVDSLTTSIRYSVDMVQTRRQSQVEGANSTVGTRAKEDNPTSNKRTIGNNSLASKPRKRRKVIIVGESIGSPEGITDSDMGESITVLPDLPVRPKDKGEVVEREAREFMTSGTLEPEETKTRSNEPPKPTHIRFASEEPDPQMAATATVPRKNSVKHVTEDLENDESEDNAPEAVTLLSGQGQAKSREKEAAKALERQEASAKKKRKDRDAWLKEQAASSKRNRKRKFRDLQEDEASPAIPNGAIYTESKDRSPAKSGLPALLPDEILLAEPAVRPPTPPLERNGQKQTRLVGRHKIFKEEKPLKDVKRGPVSVRILESTNRFLAPKVGKLSSFSKQKWLTGRIGRNGRGSIERRKIARGFLRLR